MSLSDGQGKVLVEKSCELKGDGTYEKVDFELVPTTGTTDGSFCISLKSPGKVELGFAFLQPGEWGRVKGDPLRKLFVAALNR